MLPEILPIRQNLVVFTKPTKDTYNISSRGGNMCLNRFCIDEDAAFESSGFVEDEGEGKGMGIFRLP